MRRLLACLAVFMLLAGPTSAATLLNPAGQPVGGQWQAWLNGSQELTYLGPMTLDIGNLCPQGVEELACTSDYGFSPDMADSQLPETAINLSALNAYSYTFTAAQIEQWALLYEQGHVVDFEYLTNGERAELLADWGVPLPAGDSIDQFWWHGIENEDGLQALAPVMGEWFAAAYSICALYGRRLTWLQVQYVGGNLIPTEASSLVSGLPILQAASNPGTESPADDRALHIQLETCALIGTIAPPN